MQNQTSEGVNLENPQTRIIGALKVYALATRLGFRVLRQITSPEGLSASNQHVLLPRKTSFSPFDSQMYVLSSGTLPLQSCSLSPLQCTETAQHKTTQSKNISNQTQHSAQHHNTTHTKYKTNQTKIEKKETRQDKTSNNPDPLNRKP